MLNVLDVSAVNLKTRHKSSVVAQNAETCMISELYMSNIPWRKRAAGAFVHTGNKKILEIEKKKTNKHKQTNNNIKHKTDIRYNAKKDSESGKRTNYCNLTHIHRHRGRGCKAAYINRFTACHQIRNRMTAHS